MWRCRTREGMSLQAFGTCQAAPKGRGRSGLQKNLSELPTDWLETGPSAAFTNGQEGWHKDPYQWGRPIAWG